MDQQQFEGLSRRVGQAVGRRSVLHALLLAIGVRGALSGGSDEAAGKRKRKKRKPCKAPRIQCGKSCLPAGRCCTDAQCTQVTGQRCAGNTCRCPSGQVVADNACEAPCNPACAECQRCDDGVCVDLADGAACTGGGVCRDKVCKPDRSLGCTVAQDSCTTGIGVNCPGNPANNTFCHLDLDGDPICAIVICTNDTTGAACTGLTGAGSIVVPCTAICGAPDINKTHMCVGPPDE